MLKTIKSDAQDIKEDVKEDERKESVMVDESKDIEVNEQEAIA